MLMATLRLARARLPEFVRAIAPTRTATDDEETGRAQTRREQPEPPVGRDQAASSAFTGNPKPWHGRVATIELDAGSVRVAARHVQEQLGSAPASIVNAAPKAVVNLLA